MNIKKITTTPLSGNDMMKALNYKCNLLTYTELTKYNNIFDAMGEYKVLILLYLSKKNYGHWTTVFERDNGNIEFFDSYGYLMDDELKLIKNLNFKTLSSQNKPYLTYLLYKSKRSIEYNNYQFQEKNKRIATCGRHVLIRLKFKYLTIDEYINYIKDININPDIIVSFLTYNL